MTVEKWAADQPEDAWQRVTTRDSTKGLLNVDILTPYLTNQACPTPKKELFC